jgi:FKBP-type peptidyl-prolyl cis-trans isomerase FklB
MNRFIICLATVLVASIGLAQDKTELKDQKDKASYAIGLELGTSLKKGKMDVNTNTLVKGLNDGLSGAKPLLTEEQVKETMTALQKEMMDKQAAAAKEAGEKNKAEGDKFLAENKKKEGVKTTASGLQYKVMKEGTGESPKETDMVVTNYKGTTLDGTEFDSSYKRNEPATFPVNRVIKGWTEALMMMKPGAKYQLFIPSNLAYGERAVGKDIGPNSTLVFEVELVGIKPPDPTPTPPPPGAANKPSSPAAAAPPAPIAKASATPQKK